MINEEVVFVENTNNTAEVYTVGIKLNSKEDYDRLMERHSKSGFFGIDFKGLFEGYPEEGQYPCLVEYYVSYNPHSVLMYNLQLKEIVDDGYLIQTKKGE